MNSCANIYPSVWGAAIAKEMGIGRASVYRALG